MADEYFDKALDRRRFLKTGLTLAGAASLAPLLSACGGSSSGGSSAGTSGTAAPTGTPKRGGTLRLGMTGGTSADTLNPLKIVTIVDYARAAQLYDPLALLDLNGQSKLVLAEEATPNKDATEWTLRIHKGVTFHDGKECTSADVSYTLQVLSDPSKPVTGTNLYTRIDPKRIKPVDKYTVSVGCHAPFSTFVDALASAYSWVVPENYDPTAKPNGTGPFRYKNFVPGVSSHFTRNDNYWVRDKPYVNAVIIDDYQDESSQVNALVSNSLDGITFLSAPSIATLRQGGAKVAIRKSGFWNPFTMRVDVAPFNDVRVRQAFRLIVDRPQMLEVVFGGHGAVGNDLYGVWDPDFDHSIPQREQDLDRAKSLLRQAGASGLSVDLVTSPVAQGVVSSAAVFAQQAKGAGVHVTLKQVTPTTFFGPNYLKWAFSQDEWTYFPYFPQVALSSVNGAPFNETHYTNPRFAGLYEQALSTPDAAKRRQIAHEMQTLFWDDSGYIVPILAPAIDGYTSKLMGVVESLDGYPFNWFDLKSLWFG